MRSGHSVSVIFSPHLEYLDENMRCHCPIVQKSHPFVTCKPMGRAESWLETLAAFGCNLFLYGRGGRVPLWARDSGYDRAGLDLLVQRSDDWYARRKQERTIKKGDRVAVFGRGIAVVERADRREVLARLWNRCLLRIGRRGIVWDDGNMRWEANPSDVLDAAPLATRLALTNQKQEEWRTDYVDNRGERIGSLTTAVSNDRSVTINRLNDATTVTIRDRNTGEVKSETYVGDSPFGK